MSRAALPAWFSRPRRDSRAHSRRLVQVVALVLVLIAAALLWKNWGARGEVEVDRLPPAERHALYERALADLALCAAGAGEALADHCAHQAQLVVKFPECDARCRSLAEPWRATPTR